MEWPPFLSVLTIQMMIMSWHLKEESRVGKITKELVFHQCGLSLILDFIISFSTWLQEAFVWLLLSWFSSLSQNWYWLICGLRTSTSLVFSKNPETYRTSSLPLLLVVLLVTIKTVVWFHKISITPSPFQPPTMEVFCINFALFSWSHN